MTPSKLWRTKWIFNFCHQTSNKALGRNLTACPAIENIPLYRDIPERRIGGVDVICFANVNYRILYLLASTGKSDQVLFWVFAPLILQCGACAIRAVSDLGNHEAFLHSFSLSPPNKFIFQNDVAKLGDAVLIPSWASIIITCYN